MARLFRVLWSHWTRRFAAAPRSPLRSSGKLAVECLEERNAPTGVWIGGGHRTLSEVIGDPTDLRNPYNYDPVGAIGASIVFKSPHTFRIENQWFSQPFNLTPKLPVGADFDAFGDMRVEAGLPSTATIRIDGLLRVRNLSLASGLFGGDGRMYAQSVLWTGGTVQVGSIGREDDGLNTNLLTLANASLVSVRGTGKVVAQSVLQTGAGGLRLNDTGTQFVNSGEYRTKINGNFLQGPGVFINRGQLVKDASTTTGTATVASLFTNDGGTISVGNGTLVLPSSTYINGGRFEIFNGGTLDLTGGNTSVLSGTFDGNGHGSGRVLFGNGGILVVGSSGATLRLNGDGPGPFEWSNGRIDARAAPLVNEGKFAITSGIGTLLYGAFDNRGTITQTAITGYRIESGGALTNYGTYDLRTDAFTSGGSGRFVNKGTLVKSGGSGGSSVGGYFTNDGGTVEARSGILNLNYSTYTNGGTFKASPGAVIDLVASAYNPSPASGTFTGSGGGTVRLSAEGLKAQAPGLTLAFPAGLFQWSGGTLDARTASIINSGTVTLSGTGSRHIYGPMTNQGLMVQNTTSSFRIESGGTLTNTGTYDLQADAFTTGGSGRFVNKGTLVKSAGTGTSAVSSYFTNDGGTVEARSGILNLNYSTYTNGGTFKASPGAVIDLAAKAYNSSPASGTFTGSGGGIVRLSAEGLKAEAPGLTLNFPAGLFHWTGGVLDGRTAAIANSGTVTLSGTGTRYAYGTINNQGTMVQTSASAFRIESGARLTNKVGAFYDLKIDGTNTTGSGTLVNEGTLRKSVGTGTSVINSYFENPGTVEVTSGRLSVPKLRQQLSGTSLTGGTWVVTNAALDVGSVALTTNAAHVTLDGANAIFPNLDRMATNNGTFTIQGGKSFTTFGALSGTGTIGLGSGAGTLSVRGNYVQTGGLRASLSSTATGRVAVTGSVTLGGPLTLLPSVGLQSGQSFVLLDNDGSDAVNGTFAGATEDSLVPIAGGGSGRITYRGGTGNDVVLTVVTAPTGDIGLSPNQVPENSAAGTAVGTLSVVGFDPGLAFTYSLVDNAGGRFQVNGGQIQVANGSLLDFETANSHTIRVRATASGGVTLEKNLTVGLSNVNDAPTNLTLSASTVLEKSPTGTVVGTLSTTDPDVGDTHTYSLLNDAGGRFKVVGNQVQVNNGALLDYETAISHTLRVQTVDAGSLSFVRDFTINVTDKLDSRPPTNVALSTNQIAEASPTNTVVGNLTATDPDPGESHTFALMNDAGGRFKLVGNEIQVNNGALLDYETSRSHVVRVRATDPEGLYLDKDLTVAVLNRPDAPTVIAPASQTGVIGVVKALTLGSFLDPDGRSPWAVEVNWGDGKSPTRFTRTSTGSLGTISHTFDAGITYTVQVRVTDVGGLTGTGSFLVSVSDPVPVDVTTRVLISRGLMIRDPVTLRWKQTVTIKNNSSQAITGPISLILENLTAGVALFNRTGFTQSGKPYRNFTVSGSILNPLASVSVVLEFTAPSGAISWQSRVVAGPGTRR